MAQQTELTILLNARNNASGQIDRVKRSFQQMSNVFLGAGGLYAIARAFREATKAATEFNKNLHNVWTLVDASREQLGAIGNEVRDLAKNFQTSAQESTRALYQIYSSTFYGADAMNILGESTKMAAAGLSDVFSVSDMVTTVLNAFNLEASETTRIADLLFTTIRYGKVTMPELAHQFGRLAGVAAPAGAKISELTAGIATLTRQGINADWAVTALRQTFMMLIRPSGELQKAIEDVGYATGRAMIQAEGFAGTLRLLSDYSERTGTDMAELFRNVRAIMAVLPLAETSADEYAKDLERMAQAGGAMGEAFEKQTQAWSFQLKKIKTAINDIGITIGSVFVPALISALKTIQILLTPLEWMFEAFDRLGGTILVQAATAIGTVTAAVWGLTKAWGALQAVMAMNIIPKMTAMGVVGTSLGKFLKSFGAGGMLGGAGLVGGGLLAGGLAVKTLIDFDLKLGEVSGEQSVWRGLWQSLLAAGGMAAAGAVVGSIIPGVGTAAGAMAGAAIGGVIATIRVVHEITERGEKSVEELKERAAEIIRENIAQLPVAIGGNTEEILRAGVSSVAKQLTSLDEEYAANRGAVQIMTDTIVTFYEEVRKRFGLWSQRTGWQVSPTTRREQLYGQGQVFTDGIRDIGTILPTVADFIATAREKMQGLLDTIHDGGSTLEQSYAAWEDLSDMTKKWTEYADFAAKSGYRNAEAIAALATELQNLMPEELGKYAQAVQDLANEFQVAKEVYQEATEGSLERAMAEQDLISIYNKLTSLQNETGVAAENLSDKWKDMIDWLKEVGIEIERISTLTYQQTIQSYQGMLESENPAEAIAGAMGLLSLYRQMTSQREELKNTELSYLNDALAPHIQQLEKLYGFTQKAVEEESKLQGFLDKTFTGFLKGLIDLFFAISEIDQEKMGLAAKNLSAAWTAITDIISGKQTIGEGLGAAKQSAALAFQQFTSAGGLDVASILISLGKMALDALKAIVDEIVSSAQETLQSFASGIVSILGSIKDAANRLIQSFANLISQTEAYTRLQQAMQSIWERIFNALLGFLMPIVGVLEYFLSETAATVDTFTSTVQDTLSSYNLPGGFKLERAAWGVATPGQPWGGEEEQPGDEAQDESTWISDLIEQFGGLIDDAIAPLKSFLELMKSIWQALAPSILKATLLSIERFGAALLELGTRIEQDLVPLLKQHLPVIIQGTLDFFFGAIVGAATFWVSITEEVIDELDLLARAFGRIGAKLPGFMDDLAKGLASILEDVIWAFTGLINWVESTLMPDMRNLFGGLGDWWREDISPFLREEVFPDLAKAGKFLYDQLKALIDFIGPKMKPLLEELWSVLKGFWDSSLKPFIDGMSAWIQDNWPELERILKELLTKALNKFMGKLETAAAYVQTKSGDLMAGLKTIWESESLSLWDKLKATFGLSAIALWDWLKEEAQPLVDALGRLWDAIQPVVNIIAGAAGITLIVAIKVLTGIVDLLSIAIKAVLTPFRWLVVSIHNVAEFLDALRPGIQNPEYWSYGTSWNQIFGGVESAQSGADVVSGGLIRVHDNEQIVPAKVRSYSGGSSNNFYGDLHFHGVQNPQQFEQEMERYLRRKNVRGTGNRTGTYATQGTA